MKKEYFVVHPLDDVAEAKIRTEDLGPMEMTGAVRWSLMSLRVYLLVMFVVVVWRVVSMAR